MKWGIFDSRPKHNLKPFLFTTGNGKYEPAIFDDKEKADRMASMMNAITTITTYVVKPMKG